MANGCQAPLFPTRLYWLRKRTLRNIQSGHTRIRVLLRYCISGSVDKALLGSLVPQLVHIRGKYRLATLVQLVGKDSKQM